MSRAWKLAINIHTVISELLVILFRVWLQLQRLWFCDNCINLDFHRLQVVQYCLKHTETIIHNLFNWLENDIKVHKDLSLQERSIWFVTYSGTCLMRCTWVLLHVFWNTTSGDKWNNGVFFNYSGIRKVKLFGILTGQEMTGFRDGNGIGWTTCKQSAPHSGLITMPTLYCSKPNISAISVTWLHGFLGLLTDTSQIIHLYLLVLLFPLFSCWFRAVDWAESRQLPRAH